MQADVYLRQIKNEESHWWFQGRMKIIDSLINESINSKKKINILDYGSGSGTNIKMLSKYGYVYAYEKDKTTAIYLKKKFKKNKRIKIISRPKSIKFYDLIISADVIEHIRNDKNALKYLSSLLKKNGLILLTVPAYNFLFSLKDEALHHFRRYNKKTLTKLILNYFNIIKLSYFNFFLFIPIAFSILLLKILNVQFINSVETKPNLIFNKILYIFFRYEKYFLKYLNFPFGLSIIAMAKKK